MRRVAGIDCGTNSIRLLIADLDDQGCLRDLLRRSEIVRLGEGVDRTGRLSGAALERTRAALADYSAQIREHGVEAVRMAATSASRDAANADEFAAMVESVLGVAPEVISGDEEARLSYTGAVTRLPESGDQRLLVDIGGGSTEFVRGDSSQVLAAHSADVGSVRMTERHLLSDPPAPQQIRAAVDDITAIVDGALKLADPGRTGRELVAVAGTATTMAGIILDRDPDTVDNTRLSYKQIATAAESLAAVDLQQRLAVPRLPPGRADVIVGGALVLRTIMERSGQSSVIVSGHDILDGITFSA